MSIDEAIAIAFSKEEVPATIRLYQWSKPAFSIGSFQKLDQYWLDDLNASHVEIIRRITGGRGLLHDQEITYSVVASTKDPLFTGGIKGTYFRIAKGLLAGLKRIGIDGEIHTPRHEGVVLRRRDPLCFTSTSWYEITTRGEKLIGSAQRRWRSHFLQHGSLVLQKSRVKGHLPDGENNTRFKSKKQIVLADLLKAMPSVKIIEQALKTGFESALGICLLPGERTEEETKYAEQLVSTKYGDEKWNLYREIL